MDKWITLRHYPHVVFTDETEYEIDILLDQTKKTWLSLDVSRIELVADDPIAYSRKHKARTSYV